MVKTIALFFAVIFIISAVSALEIKTQKDVFMKGETFQATLSGNILQDIKTEDVGFYHGHVQIPVTYGIAKINKTYQIYAVLPYSSQNYTLIIKNVYFIEQGKTQTLDIQKNFIVGNQTAEFSVSPGFIISSGDFPVTLTSNSDSDISVSYSLENTSYSVLLSPWEIKKITISASNIGQTIITNFELNSPSQTYKIPVYILRNSTFSGDNSGNSSGSESTSSISDKLRFSHSKLSAGLTKGEYYNFDNQLFNLGNSDSSNITLSASADISGFISFSYLSIQPIKPDQVGIINFTARFTRSGNFTGYIEAKSDNSSAKMFVNFIVSENMTPYASVIGQNTCDSLGGKKCVQGKFCQGSNKVASDGFCCIGSCVDSQQQASSSSSSGSNWIAVTVAVVLLLVILAFVFFKFKKSKISSSDILKKKEESFEERFETKNRLTKV